MADGRSGYQPLITRFFAKNSAKVQAEELVRETEKRGDLNDEEKEEMATSLAAVMKSSARSEVTLQGYSEELISEMLQWVAESSEARARQKAREKYGKIVPESTLRGWVKKRKNITTAPGESIKFQYQRRGPKSQIPDEVAKFVLDNLKLYQERGVTITMFVAKYEYIP